MKSGKWTAAQNKAEQDDVVDSVGELVALCEKDGFIPRYFTSGPQDHVDRVLEDLKKYTHDLMVEETGLSSMVEVALKQIEEEKERIKAAAEAPEQDEEDKLFDYENTDFLNDQDFVDFKEFENDLSEEDKDYYDSLLEEWEEEDD